MATVIAGMTVSLDGFVADLSGKAGRLYTDLADLRGSASMKATIEETGAVVMGLLKEFPPRRRGPRSRAKQSARNHAQGELP